jgi:putative endonuclease
MSESQLLGQKGEELAADFLIAAGFKILFRNWQWGRHEIDIIAENKDYIVFVEVKTRSDDYLVEPGASINRDKRRGIVSAANGYLQRFKIDKEARFDIITIIQSIDSHKIDHIEDAFYPTLR